MKTNSKPKMHFLNHLSSALEELARRMEYGAVKHNVKGVQTLDAETYIDKAIRHLLKVRLSVGGKLTPVTRCHAVAASFNCLALVEKWSEGEETDDFVNTSTTGLRQSTPTSEPYVPRK